MSFFSNMASDEFTVKFQTGVEFNANNASTLFDNCVNYNADTRIIDSIRNADYMFRNCYNFNSNVYIDTTYSNLCSANSMFENCNNFSKDLNMTYGVHHMNNMLTGAYNYNNTVHIHTVGLYNEIGNFYRACANWGGNFNISWENGVHPYNMSGMFKNCPNLNKNINVPINGEDVSELFYGCTSLNKNIKLHARANSASCFYGCTSFNTNISIPSNANISNMFCGCVNLDQPMFVPIPAGLTAEEQRYNIYGLFKDCSKLNSAISFDTGILSTSGMFYNCSNFDTQISLSSTIQDLSYMFAECNKFNRAITIPSLASNTSGMYLNCTNYNKAITIPDTVVDTSFMFYGCDKYNQATTIPIRTTSMSFMFANCNSFDKAIQFPDIIEDVGGAFKGCSNYTQPIAIGENCIDMQYVAYDTKVTDISCMSDINIENTYNMVNLRGNGISSMISGASVNSSIMSFNFNNNYITEDIINANNVAKEQLGITSQPNNYADYVDNYHDGKGAIGSLNWLGSGTEFYVPYYDYPNCSSEADVPSHQYYINLHLI